MGAGFPRRRFLSTRAKIHVLERHATACRRAYRQRWAVLACRKYLPVMQAIAVVSTRKPELFCSTFRFEDIPYSAAGNNFALHGIAPEDNFGVQLVCLRS